MRETSYVLTFCNCNDTFSYEVKSMYVHVLHSVINPDTVIKYSQEFSSHRISLSTWQKSVSQYLSDGLSMGEVCRVKVGGYLVKESGRVVG